jgi:hypothetical protein
MIFNVGLYFIYYFGNKKRYIIVDGLMIYSLEKYGYAVLATQIEVQPENNFH